MRFVLYTHSLVSDWNHGNAHFLRGVLRELQARGHATLALEPAESWSRSNLVAMQGPEAAARFASDFPGLRSLAYDADFDHAAALDDADVVLVHEWTDAALVARLGAMRRAGAGFTLLFHDTHHRGVSDQQAIGAMALDGYDAVLAFGESLRERYLRQGWGRHVFTWHEAADIRLFRPPEAESARTGLVWIGNWGDGEREQELREFLIEPARMLGLPGVVHGVRYPAHALQALATTSLGYGGWIANADAPAAFARHRMTVHVPRRPYVEALPGIPTIRVFEVLACGIPLISAPWNDSERLFEPDRDFISVRNGAAMTAQLRTLDNDPAMRAEVARNGLETILTRHTCGHRVDELFRILAAHGSARVVRQMAQVETVA
nr:glycosyltransferase [uncultured Lichenicoccus sp.]